MRHLVLAASLTFVVGAGCIFDPQPEPPGADNGQATGTTTSTATNSSTGGGVVGPPLGGAGGAGASLEGGLLAGSDRDNQDHAGLVDVGGAGAGSGGEAGSVGEGGEGGA